MTDSKYWRIRMKYGAYEELTQEAWRRNQVGIWYGAWGADELAKALQSEDALESLSRANKRHGLDWDMPPVFFNIAKRFKSISRRDWVLVYFNNTLSLAHVCSDIRSSPTHPLNRGGETFKFRRVRSKKSFSLDRLPDAFRLLRGVGRGNVFQPRGCSELIKLLGASTTEADVSGLLETKNLFEFLQLLGPTSWESVCQAYLSLQHHFVPTGLRYGGTLPDFDIIGRRLTDGARIFAQCKKDPNPIEVDGRFTDAIGKPSRDRLAFYFAFGGCAGAIPPHVRVIDGEMIVHWSKTRTGSRYFKWLRGE